VLSWSNTATAQTTAACAAGQREGVQPPVPNRPLNTRLGRREPDLRLVQRTPAMIADVTQTLDRRLDTEQRSGERLRMLREATNQITRSANDAIQAYRRARDSVDAEPAMPDGDLAHARRMNADLDLARAEVLAALDVASRRYPTDQE
jgi:hypothetical protein